MYEKKIFMKLMSFKLYLQCNYFFLYLSTIHFKTDFVNLFLLYSSLKVFFFFFKLSCIKFLLVLDVISYCWGWFIIKASFKNMDNNTYIVITVLKCAVSFVRYLYHHLLLTILFIKFSTLICNCWVASKFETFHGTFFCIYSKFPCCYWLWNHLYWKV